MTTHRKPANAPGGKSPGRRPAERLSRRLWLALLAMALLFAMAGCGSGIDTERAKEVDEADNTLIRIIKENLRMLPSEIAKQLTNNSGEVDEKAVIGARRIWLSGSENAEKSVSISVTNQYINMTSYLDKLEELKYIRKFNTFNRLNNRVIKLTKDAENVKVEYAAKKLFTLTITR